jgi:hypothetical protein
MSMSIRSLAQLHLGKALMISINTKLIEQEKTSIGRLIIVEHNLSRFEALLPHGQPVPHLR